MEPEKLVFAIIKLLQLYSQITDKFGLALDAELPLSLFKINLETMEI